MNKILFPASLLLLTAAALAQQPARSDSASASPPQPSSDIIIHEIPAAQPAMAEQPRPVTKTKPDRRSIKRAFFMSLAVPGSGEHYANGGMRYTVPFLTAEGVILAFGAHAYFQYATRRSDYRNLAASRAGANYSRSDDNYYRDIYEYASSDLYNEDQWRQAREQFPNDPQAQAAFVAGKLYPAGDGWRWNSENDWSSYRELRVKSRQALQRIVNAVPVLVVNHLLSAFNAARLARSHNIRQARKTAAIDWRLDLGRDEGAYQLRLVGNF